MPSNSAAGSNPIGNDGIGGASDTPDVTKYKAFLVEDTNHLFYAPNDKYKDLLGDLGLKDIDSDKDAREKAVRLRRGYGYIRVRIRVASGASLSLVCSPAKIGTAIKAIRNNKCYDEDIIWSYVSSR
jgi:hypothetical protein